MIIMDFVSFKFFCALYNIDENILKELNVKKTSGKNIRKKKKENRSI